MQTMREKWTDERLDDLNAKVDRGFERVDVQIAGLRTEMNARFEGLRAEVNARFDALNRTLLGLGGTLLVAIVASNLAS